MEERGIYIWLFAAWYHSLFTGEEGSRGSKAYGTGRATKEGGGKRERNCRSCKLDDNSVAICLWSSIITLRCHRRCSGVPEQCCDSSFFGHQARKAMEQETIAKVRSSFWIKIDILCFYFQLQNAKYTLSGIFDICNPCTDKKFADPFDRPFQQMLGFPIDSDHISEDCSICQRLDLSDTPLLPWPSRCFYRCTNASSNVSLDA